MMDGLDGQSRNGRKIDLKTDSNVCSRCRRHFFCHGVVHHEQLEVADAHARSLVVVDVLGPSPALDVQQLTEIRVLKLDCHQRTLVMLLVLEGEIVGREAARGGVVSHVAHALFVSRIFAAAVDPDLILVDLLLDVLLQVGRHLLRKVFGIVVGIVAHAVDPVQLQEDARLSDVVAVTLGVAGAEGGQVEMAGFSGSRLNLVRLGTLLALVGVGPQEIFQPVGPTSPSGYVSRVLLLVLVEEDHGRVDKSVGLLRSQSESRRRSNDALLGNPLGRRHVERLPEDEHH